MKVCAVLLLGCLSLAVAYPAQKDETKDTFDDSVDFVPLEKRGKQGDYGDTGVVDTGAFPFYGGFGVFNSLDAMMTRLRNQISSLLHSLPREEDEDGSSGFPGIRFPGFGSIDLSKGNTTSVTKIIDGHKVVINETDYIDENPNGGSFFKVRIVNVQPEDSAEEATQKSVTPQPTQPGKEREVEPLEDSLENEISKNKEELLESLDGGDFEPYVEEWDDTEAAEPYLNNKVDEVDDQQNHQYYHDLSNDIYVNQLMADQQAPINPDAELIDTELLVKNARIKQAPPLPLSEDVVFFH